MGASSVAGAGDSGGRYRLTGLLKCAAGVELHLGSDLSSGDPVFVKRVRAADVSPGAQLRLQHDAEALRALGETSLAALLDVVQGDDGLLLVARFVPGTALDERIARAGPLPVQDAVAVGRAVMRALAAAHEHGVLHRDVEPASIVVGEGSPPRDVTLVHFGLARTERADAALQDLAPETAAYASPEQAGLVHAEVAERADLYSAGIVLYECLAGRPPFHGSNVGEVLRQHLAVRAPSLGGAPRALDAVVQRLLEKDPRDRYQSAGAALADLDEIAAALERGDADPSVAVGAHDRRRTLTEPAFVGREREAQAFEAELDRAFAGESRLLLVEGESGAGKTRMLDRAAVSARRRSAWVLRGQAADRASPRPLHVLDRVVAEVVREARADPAFADALRSRLGEHLETLCRALPPLLELLAPGMLVSLGPEAHGEARLLPALVALLDALGGPSRRAVILLDDCQWLDELSLKLLALWHRNRAGSSGRGGALVVAAYRAEEVGRDSPLLGLARATRIALGRLADDEVGRMAESMAGALPAEAVSLLVRLSEGNPFLAAATLTGLVESGALVGTPRGWELEPEAMRGAQSSRRAAEFLARRLDTLSPSTLELLTVGAVLGKSFELRPAAELAAKSPAAAMAAVAEARRRHLLWLESPDGRCVFVHDRIREAVLERLAPGERVRLHRLAAFGLERGAPGPDRAFDLAYHFDAAGEHARALPHALSAAAQARAQYALQTAERLYRIAERGAPEGGVGPDTRRQIAEALGDVLLLRGRYDEAGERLSQALALARTRVERAAIEGKLGELAFKRGDVRAASEALERALRLLGRRVPVRRATFAVATLWQALVQVAHTLLPRGLVQRRSLEGGGPDLLAARLYSRLAYAYWFRRGQVATFWAHLSELNLAERFPPTRELAQACSEHAISVTGLPELLFSRGVRYAERGLEIRRALGDVWGQGQSENFHGLLLYAFGHYVEAREKFREALRLLRRTGDRWEANVAHFHLAFCHYRLGELREAVEECHRVYREGVELGDGHATGSALEIWSKASGGAIPEELVQAALRSSEGDPQTSAMALQAEGVRRIGAGQPEEAAKAFERAEQLVRRARLRSEYVSYLPIWVAHARRLWCAQATMATGAVLPDRLRAAESALGRGLALARRYRGNLPMALRERAHLHAMRGRFQAARRDLDASLAEAERQGARFEAAQTRLARGELGAVMGWPGAGAEADAARTLLQDMGAGFASAPLRALAPQVGPRPATLSLADRFASVVEQGRHIASALTPAEVHAALCAAASVLLRGDTSLLLATDRGEPAVLHHEGGPAEFARALVDRALREGRPVVLADADDRAAEPGAPRSALCVPVCIGARQAACLYVSHATVGALFSADEETLAGYLAALAGASLERAETFAALKELSRTLEERVTERTGELGAANAELATALQRLAEMQDQLMHTAKMAAVGTLVAGLSHEINGPLGVILGYATTTLRRLEPGHPLRPAIEAMERQARRCADLVATFLDLARKRPLDREDVPIETIVQHVVTLASLKARHKAVTIEVSMPPPGTCLLRVSRTQIESALLNVMDNAVDASPPGAGVAIEAVASDRDARAGVEVRVRDRGTGMAPDVLARVFDPFFTTKPEGQGTGLGLPLARQFAEDHDGRLSIESRPGEGTTVRIWLPVHGAAAERASS